MIIDNVLRIWSNLDKNFSESGMSNKSDYLKKLIGYDENTQTNKLNHLIEALKKESEQYDVNYMNDYTQLIACFEVIEKTVNDINEDDSLNYLFDNSIRLKDATKEYSSVDIFAPDNFILNASEMYSTKGQTAEYLQNTFGHFLPGVYEIDNEYKSLVLDDPDMFVLSEQIDLDSLLKNETISKSIVNTVVAELHSKTIQLHSVFVTSKYYEAKGSKIILKIGNFTENIKSYSVHKNTLDEQYMKKVIKIEDREVLVYLV